MRNRIRLAWARYERASAALEARAYRYGSAVVEREGEAWRRLMLARRRSNRRLMIWRALVDQEDRCSAARS